MTISSSYPPDIYLISTIVFLILFYSLRDTHRLPDIHNSGDTHLILVLMSICYQILFQISEDTTIISVSRNSKILSLEITFRDVFSEF